MVEWMSCWFDRRHKALVFGELFGYVEIPKQKNIV